MNNYRSQIKIGQIVAVLLGAIFVPAIAVAFCFAEYLRGAYPPLLRVSYLLMAILVYGPLLLLSLLVFPPVRRTSYVWLVPVVAIGSWVGLMIAVGSGGSREAFFAGLAARLQKFTPSEEIRKSVEEIISHSDGSEDALAKLKESTYLRGVVRQVVADASAEPRIVLLTDPDGDDFICYIGFGNPRPMNFGVVVASTEVAPPTRLSLKKISDRCWAYRP